MKFWVWPDCTCTLCSAMLMRKAKSWFTGYNSNVPGHEHGKIRYFVYNGGTPKYAGQINEIAENGYEGIVFTSGPTPVRHQSLETAGISQKTPH